MKRSEINAIQKNAVDFFCEQNFHLPVWAFWSADDWKKNRDRTGEIVSKKLGWDITDFGTGDFAKTGLILFTLRNGRVEKKHGRSYAEKIMIVRELQITPWHFHWNKTEDIINRAGGNLKIELSNAALDEKLADTPVKVHIDGISHSLQAGENVVLKPGESITLMPFLYHKFFGEKGSGDLLVGEVSTVNQDETDNRFLENSRFPEIEEDEKPLYLLCNEYPV